MTLSQRLTAEFAGTAMLLAVVVGSGIMGETLASGNAAIALLGNTIATGAILVVLILILGPISGAHFNPAVTVAFLIRREIRPGDAALYILMQMAGGLLGVACAHVMFEQSDLFFASGKERAGFPQAFSEGIAAFGLVLTILLCLKARAEAVAWAVGLYITAGYWFTASTSFANPAVTVARTFTDTFSGIRPEDAPAFILAQFVGAVLAVVLARYLGAGAAGKK
ncbi:MAG: aquaporin family protein [Alphaproteobacteria bacterium]|nr:aquaporin family protein [Alphaproteobacteria bacterium]MCY4318043.1 aquaporin family protein [Alphaproteobacteria bacterium]